jgi:pentapeptide MXKDX repeat protein
MLLNPLVHTLALAGLLLAGHALADDSMSRASMTNQQALKDCMERQKAGAVNMSKAQMKRLCRDKLKDQKATGDMPEEPAADTPHN